MDNPAPQTAAAFHELIELVRTADASFLDGFRAVGDEVSVVEGYRWLTEVLAVALDCFLWADTAHPQMVSLVGPTRKFGGDNADAFYHYAAIDPRRDYVLRGKRGDAVYLSITIYGGPDDGRWSNRIVATANDRDLVFDADGSFELVMRAPAKDGGAAGGASARNVVQLEADAVCVVTRDYHADPTRSRHAEWSIATADATAPPRPGDSDTAARFRATTNFLRELTGL